MKRFTVVFFALALVLAAYGQPAIAASDFPNKSITMICPFAPGGGTDALARKIAEVIEKQTGTAIIVENKIGGSGAVAFGEGALVAPDGYTITNSTVEIVLLPMAGMTSYQMSDFRGVMRMNYDATALVVRGDAPYNSLEEMKKYAAEHPGEIVLYYGSFPAPGWLATNMLRVETGMDFNAVSGGSGGAAAQIQNLLGGHIDATFMTPAEAAAYIEQGQIKVFAIASDKRVPTFPDYPTFAELGYNITVGTWRGISVPKDTPDDVVKILEKMFTDAYHSDEFQQFLTNMKFGAAFLNREDFDEQIKREITEFTPIVDKFLQ